MTRALWMALCLFLALEASAQKYNFVNWTVEDGLIQSQASFICQDKYRQLWVGTEGGISRFDGKRFNGYTIQDGLSANHINTLLSDKNGNLWIGTNAGISLYNGRNFKTLRTADKPINNILAIAQVRNNDIYATDNFNLLRVKDLSCKKIHVTGDSTEKITALYATSNQDLLVAVYRKGLYLLKDSTWSLLQPVSEAQKDLHIRSIFISSAGDTLLITHQGLYQIDHKQLKLFSKGGLQPDLPVFCLAEDSKQNLWLGTDKGCYKLEGNTLFHFDEKSGFTDNVVNCIYKDVENNLWFATNADGIFKFRENTFTYYDKSSGLSNTIVMGVIQSSDKHIYAAGYGGGLCRINASGGLERVSYKDQPVLNDCKINCLYGDNENTIWIGTLNKGVYRYSEKKGLEKIEAKAATEPIIRGATAFLKDGKGNMLIGTNQGLFLRDKEGRITRIKFGNGLVTSLKQFDAQHVIVGTSKGIFLLDENYNILPFNEEVFGNASVLCLSKSGANLWIGTTDRGVLNWNYKTHRLLHYTTADGLPSNFIYSIDVSGSRKAWIGTGFGISNLQFDPEGKILAIKNYGRSDGLLGMECNHNCLLKASDSSLWFGTTKGLFHFDPSTNISEKNQPFVLLRSVKLFSSPIDDPGLFKAEDNWFRIPEGLSLHSRQNHLTFELGAIYFTNPEDVLYKYKLEGIDKVFTTTNNPYIIYPALPPGKYTLKVRGLTKNGVASANEISYSFEIKKAFYQTRFFQVLMILLLPGTGALLAYVFTRGRQKRRQKAKELLEKIREEEFMKLRQRTAEDFHDEMGNSLTRISVLTDILRSKLSDKELEINKLVSQIKENTKALYNGSKDIIWSLNSKHDGLYEIAEHIKDIGIELFQETPVDFEFTHNVHPESKLKLKLDYSRNLTMIFKEAYSNILKHAGADKVMVDLHLNSADVLEVLIRDNGKGFNTEFTGSGNGLKNMQTRVSRMNGTINTASVPGKGTEIRFLLKDIFI